MATADQIKALIRSHTDGDEARFYAIAMQVAAQAARSGHGRLAQELRELVDRAKSKAAAAPPRRPVPLVQPKGDLAGLLVASYPKARIDDMVLEDSVRAKLDRVVVEQRQKARLSAHGLAPIRKLLLTGPPGTGKTMTAAVLAGELGLPLFTIQLHAVITKFMGETAAKLRIVFEAIAQTRGVYLFDEVDALGSDRAGGQDVGEIRRVLNSFLMFLEQDDSESVIVAATNHPALLDRALFRRFDSTIEYGIPTGRIAEAVMKARLSILETDSVDWKAAVENAANLSHADVVRACEQAAKDAILDHTTRITTAVLVAALRDRSSTR